MEELLYNLMKKVQSMIDHFDYNSTQHIILISNVFLINSNYSLIFFLLNGKKYFLAVNIRGRIIIVKVWQQFYTLYA